MLNENLVWEMMAGVAQTHADNHTKMYPLNSLFMCEHRRSFKPGEQVVIENGKIVTGTNEVPTHEITKLEGTLADNKHQITLLHLSSNEVKTIDL